VKLLITVAKRWALGQRFLSGSHSIYTELPEKLRANAQEQAEVDDFLWIMMIQWAKLAAWQVKRSTKTTSQIERTYLTSKYDSQKGKSANRVHAHMTAAVKGGSYGRHQILSRKATYHALPLLPLGNLRTVVESAYHPGEGRQLTDVQHNVSAFIHRIGLKRNVLKLLAATEGGAAATTTTSTAAASALNLLGGGVRITAGSKFTQEMEKLMHECVLWDTNNLDDNYARALQFIHTGKLLAPPLAAVTGNEREDDSLAGLPEGSMAVLLGYNPELTHALVKATFVSYQTPMKQFMEEVSRQRTYLSMSHETPKIFA
jgi:hypothetical protein